MTPPSGNPCFCLYSEVGTCLGLLGAIRAAGHV